MTTRRFSEAVMVVAVLLASTSASQADERFSKRSVNGTYVFSGAGTLGGAPAAVVGINRFDGRGNCQISARLNSVLLGGVMPLASSACTYTVDADGSGVLKVAFSIGTFRSDFVIVRDELHLVLSDPAIPGNVVASGVSKFRSGQED